MTFPAGLRTKPAEVDPGEKAHLQVSVDNLGTLLAEDCMSVWQWHSPNLACLSMLWPGKDELNPDCCFS